jgi:tetratricopeptide (TPR) repeat protein
VAKSKLILGTVMIACLAAAVFPLSPLIVSMLAIEEGDSPKTGGFAGSASCRECHEKFYQLWSTSRHGLAMQPYTAEFAKINLTHQSKDVKIGKFFYRADIAGKTGRVLEKGPEGQKKYKIAHVLGGKNVYYFLTPFPGGRLQTLPLGYDVNRKEWFDTAGSGVRHFPGGQSGQKVDWKEPAYTFNTSCYGCHVSQLTSCYDLKTGTYRTSWAEAGINCETCHGASAEHNLVFRKASKEHKREDIKILSWKNFTAEQKNAACSICHAKISPIASTFMPGDRFFDHFDLATLEDPDFYPDGRDLGENYTYTSWLMSPCAKSGKLDCIHCHTASGRYRFKAEEKANDACMPCHEKNVKNASTHSHHQQGNPGNRCISCHMPMTSFARMNRTDHSMLPPAPSATLAFMSPNACNLCHKDKDAVWADERVREWRSRDYQAPILERAALVDAARKSDWNKLPQILQYISRPDRDQIFATSLIRLVRASGDPRVIPVFCKALGDPSPLVRSAAAAALQDVPSKEAVEALVEAAGDDCRLVRIRAAASLARYGDLSLDDAGKKAVGKADREYLSSLLSRPDQWDSHYNLGNYYLDRGDPGEALISFERALKLEPGAVPALVNESIAYARSGMNGKAGEALEKALKISPDNAAANFNIGLLRAELGDMATAEKHLRAALKSDPRMVRAAYNLCMMLSGDRPDEALGFCRQAADLQPGEPGYTYMLAFAQFKKGDTGAASALLESLVTGQPSYPDSYLLLGNIYEKQGRRAEAEQLYGKALANEQVPESYKLPIRAKLEELRRSGG